MHCSGGEYQELLSKSGLNAAGAENEEASTVTMASESLGTDDARVEELFSSCLATSSSRLLRLSRAARLGRRRSCSHGAAAGRRELARPGRRAPRAEGPRGARAAKRPRGGARGADEGARGGPAPGGGRRDLELQRPRRDGRPHIEPVRAAGGARARFRGVARWSPGRSLAWSDGTPLVAAPSTRDIARVGGGGGICPVCNTVYGDEVNLCPTHKAKLIRPRTMTPVVGSRGKICPMCGSASRAEPICGKDGTQLARPLELSGPN